MKTSYLLSPLLATLLLSGCGDTTQNETTPINDVKDVEETQAEAQQRLTTQKRAQTLLASMDQEGLSDSDKIRIANASGEPDVEAYMKNLIDNALENGELTQVEATELLQADLNQIFLDIYTIASSKGETLTSKRRGLGTLLKDSVNKLAATQTGQDLGGAAFDVVLDSEGVTVTMLDMARDSRTVTNSMIDILGDKENWDEITPKMYPMLQTNTEFGEKFAALAYEMNPETQEGAPAMGRFFFSMTDRGMYGALADAMVLSDNNDVHDESVEYSTTGYMGQLMIRHAKEFFIAPNSGTQADLNTASGESYGSTDAFSNLMFDTGDIISTDENGKEVGHGDASELQNERFFYAMFRTPSSTNDFVTAMQELDTPTVTMFMDQIFLGRSNETNASEDTIQGYYNIASIAGAMNEGVNTYSFESYSDAFLGFFKLVNDSDRLYEYSVAFLNAGYHYAGFNIEEIWANYNSETPILPSPNESKQRALGQGTIDTSWSGVLYGCSADGWDRLDIWDSVTGVFSDEASSEESGAMDVFSTCMHDEIQLAVREDMVNDSKLDNNASTDITIEEAGELFTLPNFNDISFEYVYTGAYDRAALHTSFFYSDTIDDLSAWWSDFSIIDSATGAYEYTTGFVFGTDEERWAYFPNWLANTQWLDLQEYYETSNSSIDVDFSSGVVDFYILSEDANLTQTVAGLNETMVRVESDDVPLSVRNDLNLDEMQPEDITRYYVYKVTITDTMGLDEMLAALKDYIAAFGADTTNATTN